MGVSGVFVMGLIHGLCRIGSATGDGLHYWYGVPHLICDKITFASTGVVLGRLMGAFDHIKL